MDATTRFSQDVHRVRHSLEGAAWEGSQPETDVTVQPRDGDSDVYDSDDLDLILEERDFEGWADVESDSGLEGSLDEDDSAEI
jgi:hypothetical protein